MCRPMKRLAIAVIMLAACKGGDKDKPAGRAGAKGGCETTAAKVSDLVTTKTVGMLAPFSAVSLGMSRDEVAKLCPNFFMEGKDKDAKGNFSVNEIVGKFGEHYAQARLEFIADKLALIAYSLPPDIGPALTTAWGAPKVSSGAKPSNAWFDDTKHVRAMLSDVSYDGRRELEIDSYLPLDAFIEPETTRVAWKPHDVLGKTPADLLKTYPQYKKAREVSAKVKAQTDEMMKDLNKEVEAMGIDTKRDANNPEFELPPAPFNDGLDTQVILYTNDDGSVRSYGLWFHTASLSPEIGWPTQSADLIKLMDEKWGPHKTVKETLGDELVWSDPKLGLRATTRVEKPENLYLVFVRYFPLARFIGGPGEVWGFEKPERPLIGATADEIVAAYKEYAPKVANDGSTVTLYLPPTDYDGSSSRTSILAFVRKGGKVGDYRFNLPYRAYAQARAEYEAALLTKLGKPGKEKYGDTPYGKKTKVRWSKYTDTLEVIVGDD